MTFEGTLYYGYSNVWKIRVSPSGVKDGKEELFRVWIPNDSTEDNRWIFYNPKIAIIIQSKFDKSIKYYVPVSMFYTLKDAIKVMYNRIASDKVYDNLEGELYLDERKANKNRVKLTMFSDSIVFIPTIISQEADEVLLLKRGVKIESLSDPNKPSVEIEISELKSLYEILDRLDVNTYSLILTLAERIDNMDNKLDKIIDLQTKILKLIEKENIKSIKDQFTVEW